MRSPEDTIAAIATPLGEAGLGVIRVSGAQSLALVSRLFHSTKKQNILSSPGYTCLIGSIQSEADEHSIDRVVITIFRAPHSYTGDDVVEISAHGSPFILEQILQRCLRAGARTAEPGEFTERAFLNGKMDLTQAEAVAELIHAKTEKSRAAAMAQLEGHLAKEIRRVRDPLVSILAHIEVGLDHSDEDHDFLQRTAFLKQCAEIQKSLEHILASERIGKILRQGLRVALVGRPNVGKSSLLNALLREERAIVTPIAGTTRDTLEESINWNGLPVVLTDTAGLRSGSNDPVEKLGIERSHQALDAADILLGLLDASQPIGEEDQSVLKKCIVKPHIWVVNKCDLPAQWSPEELSRLNGQAPVVEVSAKTGQGLTELISAIQAFANKEKASAGEAQWMLNARHRDALIRAQEALTRATEAAQKEAFEECVALEVRTALNALGEIIGETSTDDLLGQIFSQFCIGK